MLFHSEKTNVKSSCQRLGYNGVCIMVGFAQLPKERRVPHPAGALNGQMRVNGRPLPSSY